MPRLRDSVRVLLFLLIGTANQFCRAESNSILEDASHIRAADEVVAFGMQVQKTALDCSHFVNSVFQQAGLYYKYEPSRVLYRGTAAFKRVYRPKPGDLIVWPEHVGIIIDPEHTLFLSALTRGVRVSSYVSKYWRRRGHARFLRYRLPPNESQFVWQASSVDGARETFVNPGMQ